MLENLYRVSQSWFKGEPRPFIRYAVEEIERKWREKNFFVIEAPTGYGKSTISATIALHSLMDEFKCIIAYPLRTLLEDQFSKFSGKNSFLEEPFKFVGKRYMHNYSSPYLTKPITLTTVDTLALTLFGIPPEELERIIEDRSLGHYFFSWASVVFSNLVLDEVHLLCDSTKSLSFLAALMRIAESFDQRLVFMSATLPNALKSQLSEVGGEKIEFLSFECEKDREFCEERLSKEYEIEVERLKVEEKFEKIFEKIKQSDFSRVLVVFNTVNEAVEFFKAYSDKLREISENVLLIHSRFAEEDREEKMRKVREFQKAEDFVIVSTQVIEAGVDITSDFLISDLAPANSLIQRFGRFLRYGEREGRIYVWFEEAEKERYKVYDGDLALRTLKMLNEKFCVHLPIGYSKLIDGVYSAKDFKIDEKVAEKFESIFLHLEKASERALKVFFEMEGSFVREGFQIPVVSEADFSKVIPISFELFLGIRQRVSGALLGEERERVEASDKRLEFLRWNLSPETLMKMMLKHRIFAFILKADYNKDLGLVL